VIDSSIPWQLNVQITCNPAWIESAMISVTIYCKYICIMNKSCDLGFSSKCYKQLCQIIEMNHHKRRRNVQNKKQSRIWPSNPILVPLIGSELALGTVRAVIRANFSIATRLASSIFVVGGSSHLPIGAPASKRK